MMVLEPIYLDLSSSDDDDDDRNRAGGTALMYLSKVIHMDADDDDDDVRIIEKPANHVVRRERSRVIRSALDDDECRILDADPDASPPDVVTSLDSDELVMTGEKGPVACRDFPHARYLCVHFPFKTTLHAKFCAQCHCYVCDSLAPCSLWGDGHNGNDHCHASEEPRWKTLRKVAKCGSVPPAPGPAGETRLVQSSILPHTVIQTPGGATVKRDPLIIKLKGKGRGKPSQLPHLGVRPGRPQRAIPGSTPPSHRKLHTSTPPPSRRAEEVLPPTLEAPQPSHEVQPPHSSPVLEAHHNPQPSRRSKEVQPINPPLEAPHPSGREVVRPHNPVLEAPHHRQPSRRSQEVEPPARSNPALETPHHPPGFTPHPFGREAEVQLPQSHSSVREAPPHSPGFSLQPSRRSQPPPSHPSPHHPPGFTPHPFGREEAQSSLSHSSVREAPHHSPGFDPQHSRRSQEAQPPPSHPSPHHPPGCTPHSFGREEEAQPPHHSPGFNPQPSRKSHEVQPPPHHRSPGFNPQPSQEVQPSHPEARHLSPGFTSRSSIRVESQPSHFNPVPEAPYHPPAFNPQPAQEAQPSHPEAPHRSPRFSRRVESHPNPVLEAPYHPPVFNRQRSRRSPFNSRDPPFHPPVFTPPHSPHQSRLEAPEFTSQHSGESQSPHEPSNSYNPRCVALFHPHPPRSLESGGADSTGLRPPDVFVLQHPGAAAAADVSMDVSLAASYPGSDRLAQNDASDIPIQGWEVDEFNVEEQVVTTSTFNDVFQQMAGDDYLWGHFPAW